VACTALGAAYYSQQGMTACARCPAAYQRDASATGCVHCSTLGQNRAGSQGVCDACPGGTAPTVDRTQCAACTGNGTVAPEGASACTACPAGWIANPSKTECAPCTMSGFFTATTSGVCAAAYGATALLPLAGGAACDVCTNASAVGGGGGGGGYSNPKYCRLCAVGWERTASGCARCGAGRHSSEGIACAKCPAGKRANAARSGCEACGVDEYFDGVTLACTRCGVGQQVDWPEQLGCAPCPSGRYSPDHSSCRPCAAGRAPDALSRGSCTPCGGETFSAAGHACEPCPSGTHSSSAHTECLDVHDISPLRATAYVLCAFATGGVLAGVLICQWRRRSMPPPPLSYQQPVVSIEKNPLAAAAAAAAAASSAAPSNGTTAQMVATAPYSTPRMPGPLGRAIKPAARRLIDLVFVVGCTESMEVWMHTVSIAIDSLVRAIHGQFGEQTLRIGFVGFRDYATAKDRVKRFEIAELTDNFEALRLFIISAEAKSPANNDVPDDVAGALDKCSEMPWRSATRVCVVLSDAPPHGSRFHSLEINDHFPDGDPSGLNPEALMAELAKRDVHVYFAQLCDATAQMVAMLRKAHDGVPDHWSRSGVLEMRSSRQANSTDAARFANLVVDVVARSVLYTNRRQREVRAPAAINTPWAPGSGNGTIQIHDITVEEGGVTAAAPWANHDAKGRDAEVTSNGFSQRRTQQRAEMDTSRANVPRSPQPSVPQATPGRTLLTI
jgi:hypothetical protein